MSFIKVTDKLTNTLVDINSAHIVGFAALPESEGKGSAVSMHNGDVYKVTDTCRSLRSFIKKAQGKFEGNDE